MKTLTVPGDPHTLTAIMVPDHNQFHDHDMVRIESSDSDRHAEKRIFRVVDAGNDELELQFE